ncbi:MAG: hypothetical protein ABH818_01760 [Patescibacteria group bacterium]
MWISKKNNFYFFIKRNKQNKKGRGNMPHKFKRLEELTEQAFLARKEKTFFNG